MCSPELTCLEPEHPEGMLRGLDFHRSAFEAGARGRAAQALAGEPVRWTVSSMHDPVVTLLGDRAAMVAYARHIAPLDGTGEVKRIAETRVWRLNDSGQWRLAHLHRSPMPPLGAPAPAH